MINANNIDNNKNTGNYFKWLKSFSKVGHVLNIDLFLLNDNPGDFCCC